MLLLLTHLLTIMSEGGRSCCTRLRVL